MTFFESTATDGLEAFLLTFLGIDTTITIILLVSKYRLGVGLKLKLKR